MKYTLILLLGFVSAISSQSQEIAEQLRQRYRIDRGFDATVIIRVDVPGITASPKTVEVHYEKGKKLKIKGAGLILMPKKGFADQFSELLNAKTQWIHLETIGDIQTFKVVSLDPGSDWITADLKVNMKVMRIDEINLATRESGSFLISHFYGIGNYPDRTEIGFSTDKFSIPLKVLGKFETSGMKDANGRVSGRIILEFKKFTAF